MTTKKQYHEIEEFINQYHEFDKWIDSIGFKRKVSTTICDIDWWEKPELMYGIEYFEHKVLGLSIRFMREKKKHIFYEVTGYKKKTPAISMEEFKMKLYKWIKKNLDKQLKNLSEIKLTKPH